MNGHSLAGMSIIRNRIDNDFYATPLSSISALLNVESIIYPALEPACGQGHISKLLKDVDSYDLIDRGYGVGGIDFINHKFTKKYATVITNPPFKLFQEFAEKALLIATDKVILFGKIQILEGIKRSKFLEDSPLSIVYVFRQRQTPMPNGFSVNEAGKKWASTMTFAWFVWEIGYKGNPIIKWI